MKSGAALSIWFFIGVSLLINGALIFATGVYEIASPPEIKVVLYDLHANLWWGALLAIFGAYFCYRFSRRRERERMASGA